MARLILILAFPVAVMIGAYALNELGNKPKSPLDHAASAIFEGQPHAVAARHLEDGCTNGVGRACRIRHVWGRLNIVSAASSDLADQACLLGDRVGCQIYGDTIRLGSDPIPDDHADAMIGQCERDDSMACEHLARYLDRLSNAWPDVACSDGSQNACATLALASLITRDIDEATAGRQLLAQCEADVGVACMFLAENYVADGSATGSVGHRIDYYQSACDLGVGMACRNGAGTAYALDQPDVGREMLVAGCSLTTAPDLCSRATYETGRSNRDVDWTAYLDFLIEDCLSGGLPACSVAAGLIEDTRLGAVNGSRWPVDGQSADILRQFAASAS